MDKHELDKLKRQSNIADVIGQYVPLKRSGTNLFACCPFHSEKTPSFTVAEDKKFYHCFGCGAHGDVLDWYINYHGMEFKDAVKALGGEIELTAPAKLARNEKRLSAFRYPHDHCEDAELSNQALQCCNHKDDYYIAPNGQRYLPLTNADGELKNLAYFEKYDTKTTAFIAGGVSYDSFYRITRNNTSNWVAVVSLQHGYGIAAKYNLNVAVCFAGDVMKYVCKWNYGELKIKPCLTGCDDDYLAHEMDHLFWDGSKLEKRELIL